MERKEQTIYMKVEENSYSFRIQATIGTRCICLHLIHEVNEELLIYTSNMILEQCVKRQAEKLDMKFDDYFEKLISFFENPCNAKFNLKNNILTITETVNHHIQVKFFYCNMERVSISSLGNLIDELQAQKMKSRMELENLINKNSVLQKDVSEYGKKLEELVERKIVDEQTMLSNFVLILNEKKRKIQHLTELLEAFRHDPSLADPVEVSLNGSKKRKIKNIKSEELAPEIKEEISESESSDSPCQNNMNEDKCSIDESKAEHMIDKYNEIFEESPTEKDSYILKITNLGASTSSTNIVPSTSKEFHSKSELETKKETKHIIDKSPDCEMINMDTQEWLDNL